MKNPFANFSYNRVQERCEEALKFLERFNSLPFGTSHRTIGNEAIFNVLQTDQWYKNALALEDVSMMAQWDPRIYSEGSGFSFVPITVERMNALMDSDEIKELNLATYLRYINYARNMPQLRLLLKYYQSMGSSIDSTSQAIKEAMNEGIMRSENGHGNKNNYYYYKHYALLNFLYGEGNWAIAIISIPGTSLASSSKSSSTTKTTAFSQKTQPVAKPLTTFASAPAEYKMLFVTIYGDVYVWDKTESVSQATSAQSGRPEQRAEAGVTYLSRWCLSETHHVFNNQNQQLDDVLKNAKIVTVTNKPTKPVVLKSRESINREEKKPKPNTPTVSGLKIEKPTVTITNANGIKMEEERTEII